MFGSVRTFAAGDRKTIKFFDENGRQIKIITAETGKKIILPGKVSAKGTTMLGWSSEQGETVDPEYKVGEVMQVFTSKRLYAVVFNRGREPDLKSSQINRQRAEALKHFDRIIFVGDSRIYNMQKALNYEFGDAVTNKVYFVAESQMGLSWFKTEGLRQLNRLVKKNTAVIFNLGVNDMKNIDYYLSYMKKTGKNLKNRGCTLFYMSVNPVNRENSKAVGRPGKSEKELLRFNARIQNELCSGEVFTYIDCFSFLMEKGYGTLATGNLTNPDGTDDGLHYTMKTYKRIYNFCLAEVASQKW